MQARFFQRVSDGVWLARVDTGSSLSLAEAELHCAAEYDFPVQGVDITLTAVDFNNLKAQRLVGAIMPPIQPPPPLTDAQTKWASSTIAERMTMIAKRLDFIQ